LSINRKYGLLAQYKRFVNVGAMSLSVFELFFLKIHYIDMKVERFLEMCEPYHLSIVETMYLFASFSCQTNLILECRDLKSKSLDYKFENVQIVSQYTGNAWFVLPKNFIWFAQRNGLVKTSRYITRETESHIVEYLKPVSQYLIIGILSQNEVIPLKVESSRCTGDWNMTRNFLQQNGYSCIMHFDSTPIYKKSYFVMDKIGLFYKMSV